jgi:hypothetical protein
MFRLETLEITPPLPPRLRTVEQWVYFLFSLASSWMDTRRTSAEFSKLDGGNF